MLYRVTVVVRRQAGNEPAGVIAVQVIREVKAPSWGAAVNQATDDILDDLLPLTGGLVGCTIVSAFAEAVADTTADLVGSGS